MTNETSNEVAHATAPKHVLVIGGTGVFGFRLAAHLAQMDGLSITLTSRSQVSADAAAAKIMSTAARSSVAGVALDHRNGLADALRRLKPWIVIDASGPFQGAGYDVPRAALEAGAHVVDLADARNYIAGYVGALDKLARDRGCVALAGASSTPTLSAAVVASLANGWQRVDTIDIAITPGGKSEVGRSVINAILSYAGRPVPIWREGRLDTAAGWVENRIFDIPGLGSRRVALVETVDAQSLGSKHRIQSRVAFYAGLESHVEQFGLMALARLRRRRWIGDVTRFIPLLLAGRKLTRLSTSNRGGMVVALTGIDRQGAWCRAVWSLLAIDGSGPNVPILPAAAAMHALMRGQLTSGARPASHALGLAEIETEMQPYPITSAVTAQQAEQSVFERALGADAFRAQPAPIVAFHSQRSAPVWRGRADVVVGNGVVARWVSRWIGLPTRAGNVASTVSVDRDLTPDGAPRETWTRNFGGQRFQSVLTCERQGALIERFGAMQFTLGVVADSTGLALPIIGWTWFGIPMPLALAPRSVARECVDAEGRFHFDVRLSLPLVGPVFGLLAHYRGWLSSPEGASDR
jgi:saccharopine dehydrogenase-like NADP-dependent oxidoreductase